MTIISGILTDGTGQIINDCTIELYAKKTTINVLTQTQAFTVTSDGRYSMNVSPCEYDVSLIINGFPKKRLGSINVYSDSRNGTLNDFLLNPKESELTPEFIKQVIDARDDAKKSANNAQKWASTIDTSTLVKKSGDTMTGDLYINGQPVLKSGDYGMGSFVGAPLSNQNDLLEGGCYATRTTEFPELTEFKNRDDSASLVVFPAATKNWCVEMLAVVNSILPRIFFRCATKNGKQPFYESITTSNINNYIPVGIPLPWPKTTPPSGWFECNGSTFDKSKFPKLATAYPSGKLPDLRGVFIRGLDTGSGLDPNRGILSYQGDAIRNIKGAIQDGPGQAFLGHENLTNGKTDGAISIRHSGDDYLHVGNRHVRWAFFDFDASRVVPVAHENRPRNVAFMYIVKAE